MEMNAATDESVPSPGRLVILALLILQSALIVVCFYPLLGYFMGQDDLALLYRSNAEPARFLGSFFGHSPHHFRPLTKMVYFFLAYKAFGLNALAYHLVSLLTHLVNSLLVFTLLRRLRLTPAAAVLASTLFALHVAFFNVIGWICCIQQLAALLFMLLSMLLIIETMRRDSTWMQLLSLGAYLLAICSLEQTLLLPPIMLVLGLFGLAGPRSGLKRSAKLLWPHFVVLGLFIVFRLYWKPLPASGNYEIVWGANLWTNALTYLSVIYDFWGNSIEGLKFTGAISVSHCLLAALVLYHLVWRRFGQVAFAAAFMMCALGPVLPLQQHTHHIHLYVPAFGAIFLLALAVDDLFSLLRFTAIRTDAQRLLAAALAIAVMGPFFYQAVRTNEQRTIAGSQERSSSVLRRSMIAERTYRDLTEKAGDMAGVETIYLMSVPATARPRSPGTGIGADEFREFRSAVKNKLGIRLFFGDFDLDVRFISDRHIEDKLDKDRTRLFFYDRTGRCYTRRELPKR